MNFFVIFQSNKTEKNNVNVKQKNFEVCYEFVFKILEISQ